MERYGRKALAKPYFAWPRKGFESEMGIEIHAGARSLGEVRLRRTVQVL